MKTFFLLTLSIAGLGAAAQLPAIPQFPSTYSTAKTTAATERLVARSKSDYSSGAYSLTDSVNMNWNWTNHSKTEFAPAPLVSFDRYSELFAYSFSSGSPAPVQKAVNYFDASGRIYANYRFRWNAGTSTWDSAARTLINWSGSQISDSTFENYFSGRGWIGRKKSTFSYSGSQLTGITNEVSSGLVTAWTNDMRYTYAWTGANMTQSMTERWESASSSWIKQYKNAISYTGTDSTESITQRWNTTAATWVNLIRRRYKISPVGPYADDSSYNWNATTADWTPATKNEVIYSGPDVSQYIQYVWDASKGNWGAYNIYYYLHNTSAQLTEAGAYRWNTTTASWEVYYSYKYFYNTAGSLTTELPFVLNSGGGFDPGSGRTDYYYETFSGIRESAHEIGSLFVVFPNPGKEAHSVQVAVKDRSLKKIDLSVRDLFGREVYRKTHDLSNSVVISTAVDNWASGCYLFTLCDERGRIETLKWTK
jgi:hypothetical protein